MTYRERLCSTSLEPWDHPRLLILTCGFAAGIGAIVGNLIVPHLVETTALHVVLVGGLTGLAVLLGCTLLAWYEINVSSPSTSA
ncbi:hypothetical protein [Natrialba sp. SSL1]|uniref:hypothetical protein n=1 Tax=Natrialba sp. SSL1 TaxID=1869245 RepID=UPI0008F89C02|nr:hypothetical protein [Natrialba sp. SSL1]OIB56889.1 hypothetical protein BBD46_14090 [Natrialba sp. SSL1]